MNAITSVTYQSLLLAAIVPKEPVLPGRSVVKQAFAVILFCFAQCWGQDRSNLPLRGNEVLSLLAASASETRLARIVHERGIDFQLGTCSKALHSAGATTAMLTLLRNEKTPNPSGVGCTTELGQAISLMRQGKYRPAEMKLRLALGSAPQDGALHMALGISLSQQERWDEAIDSFTDASRNMPGIAEVHTELAYVFFRQDDGDNAVAEARTALSMDPQNASAYRYMGLGFYSNGKYLAAINSFEQSLIREPEDADVYFEIGVTYRDQGDLRKAAIAYKHALNFAPTSGRRIAI